MTDSHSTPETAILVAVDIAKAHNEVLIELRERRSQRRRFRVANTLEEYQRLVAYLRQLGAPARWLRRAIFLRTLVRTASPSSVYSR